MLIESIAAVGLLLADDVKAPAMSVMDITTLVVAIIGVITGIAGMVLGILSHLHQIDQERVKLRVGASIALIPPNLTPEIWLTVTNLSAFPVDLSSIGLRYLDGRTLINPPMRTVEGKLLPIRMEPRTALKFSYPRTVLREIKAVKDIKCVCASTDCGEEILGGHKKIRGLIENVLTLPAD